MIDPQRGSSIPPIGVATLEVLNTAEQPLLQISRRNLETEMVLLTQV